MFHILKSDMIWVKIKNEERKEMNILFWIIRIILLFGLVIRVIDMYDLSRQYEDDVYLAESAAQATQLSNEYILMGIGMFSFIFVCAIFLIVLEMGASRYKRRKNHNELMNTLTINK